ncbi:hypothetical protein EJ05DRAFT_61035 [Pseudovirgaria hyperparasitica]|uniref:Fms interacting protein n=1 Tax=Pseudovirgaria hyperparasitica TaxID=470096 RepID=A0A6A6W5F3_9PEZI|nr:uncharacterized protein EJ05DRAFT_61035 [Pseudovirgaria hyperparasitica]KAF2757264.1 hypothetical protein EJ05DRAFT_61035 [Pseudovirgaria hyperparasitica]
MTTAASAAKTIVTSPHLQSVLSTAQQTRDACLALIDTLTSPDAFTQSNKIAPSHKHVNAQLAKIRHLNRKAVLGARETKAQTAEARSGVDTLHLQLQNLYYEQRHLRGEIGACEDYEHKYMTLPLISAQTFLDLFPDHVGYDENELMVARIEHEHMERQALEEQRQGLLRKKQGLIAENKKRREDLANLDIELEKFVNTAEPIQKIFEKEY